MHLCLGRSCVLSSIEGTPRSFFFATQFSAKGEVGYPPCRKILQSITLKVPYCVARLFRCKLFQRALRGWKVAWDEDAPQSHLSLAHSGLETRHLLSAGLHDRYHHHHHHHQNQHHQNHHHQNHHCQYKQSHYCYHHNIIIIITSLPTSDQLVWPLFHVNQLLTPFVWIFQLLLLGRCVFHLSGATRCTGQNFDLADLIFLS